MSSHHIVRDMQEPSLLIADGEQCSLALLESLLEWSPVVVALDEAFPKLVSLGIKVDYWLGDFDNIDPKRILSELQQDSVKIIKAENQEKTDFEKGIDFLIELGAQAINCVWATGNRLDHTLSNLSTLTNLQHKAKIVFYDDYSKLYFLQNKFEKWYTKNQIISLVPMPIAKNVSIAGLKYTLDKEDLEWGNRVGTSNFTEKDGIVKIAFEKGNLLMIETLKD
ncbi:MAG: thiamine diphosphokinase [Bacteroidia bacterium]